ncbi:MAG: hypothetical protein KGL53_15540, partial [Elusimicrobia bacterium]|nr:hypothetical protein [Elusimicrobiota bacterium]
ETDLAIVLRDGGHPDDAAAHWIKATLLDPADAFVWDQRGWNYLALGRMREAEDAFKKGVEAAQRADDRGEGDLGLGLALSMDGDEKAAADPLRQAAASDPYMRAAANAELERIHTRLREPALAIPYAVESLDADPRQLDVAEDLARLYRKTGQGTAEWQAWQISLDMDPDDAEAAKAKALLEKWLPGRPEDTLPVMRLGRPVFRLESDAPAAGDDDSPPIRVGLFSGPDGRMRHATHFFVMGSTMTRLHDLRLDQDMIDPAQPYQQWEVAYRPDTRAIEVRDTGGRILYVTRQPFQLIPADPRYTLLIKNVQLTDITGADIGDREVRGTVEVIPTPDGFHLVNQLSLDRYLYSVVGSPLPDGLPPKARLEAFKTMAVIARTRVMARMRGTPVNPERVQTCDSSFCLRYRGLTGERTDSARAVRETTGVTLRIA